MSQKEWGDVLKQQAERAGLRMTDVEMELHGRAVEGAKLGTYRKARAPKDPRYVTPLLLETLADITGGDVDEFAEYRLAMARAQLDERIVGLDQAVANLRLIESLLVAAPDAPRASEPGESSDRQRRAAGPALRTAE